MTAPPFVDWDPSFFPHDKTTPDKEGLVWLYDCEGTPLLKCDPESAQVIAAALEYAYADVQAIYGVGWGNLNNELVARLLRKHGGDHPHIGLRSVAPECRHHKQLSGPGLVGNEQILEVCHCGAHLILRSGSEIPEWHL